MCSTVAKPSKPLYHSEGIYISHSMLWTSTIDLLESLWSTIDLKVYWCTILFLTGPVELALRSSVYPLTQIWHTASVATVATNVFQINWFSVRDKIDEIVKIFGKIKDLESQGVI
jgi:hypothetical protein